MDWLSDINAWHWLTIGLLVLAAEAMGTAGVLLGIGLAALLQSLVVWLFPDMSWQSQIALFAVNAVVLTVLYWKVFRRHNQTTDRPAIDDRGAMMVGRTFTLEQPVTNGQGRVQIGDTFWKAVADEDLEVGTTVNVQSADLMVLKLERLK